MWTNAQLNPNTDYAATWLALREQAKRLGVAYGFDDLHAAVEQLSVGECAVFPKGCWTPLRSAISKVRDERGRRFQTREVNNKLSVEVRRVQ